MLAAVAAVLLALAPGGAGAGEGAAPGVEAALLRFRRAFADGDPAVRRKAIGILDGVPGPRATAALLPARADPSARVR
ncbi:MAG: hypothetical protein L6R43_12370, partial [Planctomycetes bacterium]|nr:hypothetical protein [Planctomycetota bacterium]